jgi:hypothetical protein
LKLFNRGGLADIAIASAGLVAAGCGGSGGSGATAAAKDSKGLDFIPKSALGYVTVDADLEGDNWKQFNELATAFDPEFDGAAKELSKAADDVDYKKEVDPWMGDSAGIALLSAKEDDIVVWIELQDKAKFEKFAKSQGWKKGAKIDEYSTYSDPEDDTTHVAYNDDIAIMTGSRASLSKRVKYDGDSITDADGVSDAIDEAGDDALVTLVVNGEGVRKAIASEKDLASLKDVEQLKDFKAAALSLAAEDKGMRLTGFVGSDGEKAFDNVEHPIFEDLPADTVLAFGGTDFGGTVKKVAEEAGKENSQIQQGIGAAEAALGIDLDDLAKNMDGEFVLGMSSDDAGLGALAGNVVGAAMGGGSSDLDPAALAKSASVILAFEETGKSSETLDKLVQAGGGLAGATGAPKTGTSGDFETKTYTVAGFPLTTASSDDVAALAVGADPFEAWGGDETLGKLDTFSDAWDAADAPDKSAGLMWLDVARIAKLAGVESGDKRELGGMVGWAESDDSNAKFGAFLHIPEK